MAAVAALPAWALIAGSAAASLGATALGGALAKPKASAAPSSTPIVDQSAAMTAARRESADDVRRRRGAAANELTGGGAEASTPGAKVLLGQ